MLLFLLTLHYIDSYGQKQPTVTQINSAKSEVAAIDSSIALTATQKEALINVLVEKNYFMSNPNMSVSRRNWAIEHNYLERINLILKKNSSNGGQAKSQTTKSLPLDEKLLKRLNLHKKVAEPAH